MPRRLLPLVSLLLAVVPAAASGDNALILHVSDVHVPDKLPGACKVSATVADVLQGSGYRTSQPVSLDVPCGMYTHAIPLAPAVQAHGAQLTMPDVLKASRIAAAHLDDAGHLIWEPTRPYGRWGAIWGYRVLDGALPLHRAVWAKVR